MAAIYRLRRLTPLLLMAFLFGCGGRDMSDLEAYVAQVKARPKGAIEPLPEIKTVETFVFNPEGLRNPFAPAERAPSPQVAVAGGGIKPDPSRPREALESYELDSLRMVGTVEKEGVLWGLVQTPEGTVYRVRTGNYMGKHDGRIIRITEDRIDLVELIAEAPGVWREQQTTVALAE